MPAHMPARYIPGYHLHNFVFTLQLVDGLPWPASFALLGLLCGVPALAWPSMPVAALLSVMVPSTIEAGLLVFGRRSGLSSGPVVGQLTLYSLGHSLAALLVAPLPLEPAVGLMLVGALQLALLGAMVWGFLVEPRSVGVRHLDLRIDSSRPGIKALVVSDLHTERSGPRERRVLEIAREVAPDLILLPGDLPSLSFVRDPHTVSDLRELIGALGSLAPLFLSRGTIEVDTVDLVEQITEGLPVTWLDAHHVVWSAPDGGRLVIAGVAASHVHEVDSSRLQRALRGAPSDLPILLLHHVPDLKDVAAEAGVSVYVAGHTHGGQIRLPFLGAMVTASQSGRRFAWGAYKVGAMDLVVTCGVGLEGLGAPRLRFLCPPEVVVLRLDAGPPPAGS